MALVVIAGIAASVIAHFADPSGSAGVLMFLASGLVLGELLVLRLENGTSIPLSYAVLLVLVASFRVPEYAVVVVGAELISAVLRMTDRSAGWRAQVMVERLLGGRRDDRRLRRVPRDDPSRRDRRRGALHARRRGRRAGTRFARGALAPAVAADVLRAGSPRLARHRVVGDAHGDRVPRRERSRPGRYLGTVALLDPAPRGLVRARAPRLRDPRVPPDDRGARDGARVRRHRASRPLAARRRALVGHGRCARRLGARHDGSRDGRAAAPPRAGHDRRARGPVAVRAAGRGRRGHERDAARDQAARGCRRHRGRRRRRPAPPRRGAGAASRERLRRPHRRDSNESSVAIETLRSAPGYVYDDKVLAALERVVGEGRLVNH